MRKLWIGAMVLVGMGMVACQSEVQPKTGSNWGQVPNGSAEQVVSDKVLDWTYGTGESVRHIHDNQAKDGTKSLLMYSATPADGSWANKVNLKPWSKYKFTAWIKTQDLKAMGEGGATITLQVGMSNYLTTTPISGTNDWTPVTLEFETGADDCAGITCTYPRRGTGYAWFDAMTFELISSEEINTALKIDPNVQGTNMSEYIYGQFIEHMGQCIYGGIWSEMLMDRKFWYAPGERNSPWSVAPTQVARPQGPQGPAQDVSLQAALYANSGRGARGMRGGADLFTMDKANAYTGEHSVLLKAGKGAKLQQSGLGVRPEVGMTGYAILKADKPTAVKVTMTSDGKTQEKTINVGTKWTKYPFEFDAFDAKNTNATFAIVTDGAAKVWVGTASIMPNDNVEGFRADVLALLKGLKAPVYRWPGGNFVSGYDWHDGIGPRDQRPPRKNPAWTGVESNDVGMHEFIRLCELLETEPYIAVNAGLGGTKMATDEVEYANGEATTPMGKLRVQNGGSVEPWNVKWWSVGNEMFGDWQLGFMATDAFALKHKEFADAMWKVDPSIKLIGVGEVGRWDEYIMKHCSDHMNLVSEHFYSQDWHGGGLMTHTSQIARHIKRVTDAHRKYRQEIPELEGKDIQICMDEWNYWYGPHIFGELGTRYYLRDALGIAAGLNEYLRQSDIVFMANYAQTVNVIGCIKATTTDAGYASTGQVLKLYREVFGTLPVQLEGELRPFDVAAAINTENNTLTISVVNPTWESVSFPIDAVKKFTLGDKEYSLAGNGEIYTVGGDDDMAFNTPGMEPNITVTNQKLSSVSNVTVQPYTANIIVIPFK
ncbi:MAG: alpha-L-arabinofuranosidase [Bacteroidales bacterium]|nr:alpha-L-arabinofuranosidase [Bacteroidales bacterium]